MKYDDEAGPDAETLSLAVGSEKVPSAASVKLITEEETTILIIRIFMK